MEVPSTTSTQEVEMFLRLKGLSGLLYAALIVELFVAGSSNADLRTSLGMAVIVVVGLYIALSVLAVMGDSDAEEAATNLGLLGVVLLVGGFTLGGSLPVDQQTMWPWFAGAALTFAVVLALFEEMDKGAEKAEKIAKEGIDVARSVARAVAGKPAAPAA